MKKNLIILLVCAALIAAGFIFNADNKGEWLPTTATITRIESVLEDDPAENTMTEKHYVYVDFTVDGQEYKDVELGSYSAGMAEGKTVNIEYRTDNPNHIRTPFAKFVPYLLWGLGGLGILYFLVMLIVGLKNR